MREIRYNFFFQIAIPTSLFVWKLVKNIVVDRSALCFVTLLGDSAVGKSAIVQVFHSDSAQFPKNYTMVCILPEYCYSRQVLHFF